MKTINSNNYFADLKNKIYEIITVKNKNEVESMINHFNNFRKIEGNKFIGLDFEFNSSPEGKKIALFQINLQSNEKTSKIYLFYPPDLNLNQMNNLVNLLIDVNIKKILHGAESLDIPYLFENILISKEDKINFCKNLIDTKYLCEFIHFYKKSNDRCKIYYFLREFNVINDNVFELLQMNEEEMGPIWLINLDIRNLSENTIIYAACDVLYLDLLYLEIKKYLENQKIDEYINIIPEISSLVFLTKNKIDDMLTVVNRLNLNYFNIEKNEYMSNVTFYYFFEMYYYWVNDKLKKFHLILEINYFKKFFQLVIKLLVYLSLYDVFDKSEWINGFNYVESLINIEKYLMQYSHSIALQSIYLEMKSSVKNDLQYYIRLKK